MSAARARQNIFQILLFGHNGHSARLPHVGFHCRAAFYLCTRFGFHKFLSMHTLIQENPCRTITCTACRYHGFFFRCIIMPVRIVSLSH